MKIEPKIVIIPKGPVVLGVPLCKPSTKDFPHIWVRQQVNVPAFGIAKYAVTMGEYLTFAKTTGYSIAEELYKDPRFKNPRAPAAFVSWIDAVRYTQWLTRETGKPYRLLRDAEYEKASRGGLKGKKFPWGDEPPEGRADFGNPD